MRLMEVKGLKILVVFQCSGKIIVKFVVGVMFRRSLFSVVQITVISVLRKYFLKTKWDDKFQKRIRETYLLGIKGDLWRLDD